MGRVTPAEPGAGWAQVLREGHRAGRAGMSPLGGGLGAGAVAGFRACRGSLCLHIGHHGRDPSPDLSCAQTAEAQLAYELQSAREQQKIRQEEIEIEVVQRKKQIDVEEKEIIRMEKELIATVKRPAEAEAYRMQQIAEGEK